MKRKNFLKKLAAVTLGFVMTLGVGAAGYAGAASETLAATEIETTAVTSVTSGEKYVIGSGTTGNVFLGAISGSWGSAVGLSSAYIFTAEGSGSSGFALKCSAGYLTPKTGSSNTFSAYGTTSKTIQLLGTNNNEVFSGANNKYNLRQNGTSGFRWYGNTSVGTTGNPAYLYKVKSGSAKFTVTYNANGATSGTAPTDSNTYASGTTVTVKANTGDLAKTDCTFDGWNTAADGTGTSYAAGTGTFTISANTTLYAKWKRASSGEELIITPETIDVVDNPLSSSGTKEVGIYKFYAQTSCKNQGDTGANKFDSSQGVILLGKSGSYLYNKTAFDNAIASFEMYWGANAGTSTGIGIQFSDSAISSYSTGAHTFTTSSETKGQVYDLSSYLTDNCKFFYFTVTSNANAQFQFKLTFKEPAPTHTVEISGGASSINAGDTTTFTASCDQTDCSEILWSSSDTSIATVDNGKVIGQKGGTITITASCPEGGSDSKTLTVIGNGLTLSPSAITDAQKGGTGSITASLNATVTGVSYSWTSNQPGVVSVTGNTATASLSYVSGGPATITCTATVNGVTFTNTCDVTVVTKDPTVSFNNPLLTGYTGISYDFTAVSANIDNGTWSWKVNDQDFTFDDDLDDGNTSVRYATFNEAGSYTIKATCTDENDATSTATKTTTIEITASSSVLTIDKTSIELQKGAKVSITPTLVVSGSYADKTNISVTKEGGVTLNKSTTTSGSPVEVTAGSTGGVAKVIFSANGQDVECAISIPSTTVDVITGKTLGLSTTSYADFSGQTFVSEAVYAGKAALEKTDTDVLKLNKDSGYGVYTSTSGGVFSKLEVDWGSSTTADRQFAIYGMHTAPTGVEDEDRVLLGKIDHNANPVQTVFEATDAFEYIILKAEKGAVYFNNIKITWTEPTPVESVTAGQDSISVSKGDSSQLTWTVLPVDASNKSVEFSMDPVLTGVTISDAGLVSVDSTATVGDETTIKIVSKENSSIYDTVDLTILKTHLDETKVLGRTGFKNFTTEQTFAYVRNSSNYLTVKYLDGTEVKSYNDGAAIWNNVVCYKYKNASDTAPDLDSQDWEVYTITSNITSADNGKWFKFVYTEDGYTQTSNAFDISVDAVTIKSSLTLYYSNSESYAHSHDFTKDAEYSRTGTVTWSILNKPSQAEISDSGILTIVDAPSSGTSMQFTVRATCGNAKSECAVTLLFEPVTSISINETSLTEVAHGTKGALSATVESEYALQEVKWESSDSATLSVTGQSGNKLKANYEAAESIAEDKNVTVTCWADENGNNVKDPFEEAKQAQKIIKVVAGEIAVTSITLDPSSVEIWQDEIDDDNNSIKITPTLNPGATVKTLQWEIVEGSDNVVTLGSSAPSQTKQLNYTGNAGEATIKATSMNEEHEQVSQTLTVTVKESKLTSITADSSASTIVKEFELGHEFSSTDYSGLSVNATFSSGNEKPVDLSDCVITCNTSKVGPSSVIVTYTLNGVTKQDSYAVVIHAPSDAKILTNQPLPGNDAYTLVEDLDDITSGNYVIAVNNGGTYYGMSNTFAKKINGTELTLNSNNEITSSVSSMIVSITVSDNNDQTTATIKNGSNYLTYSSSTDLGTSTSAYSWTISTGTKGSFRVSSQTAGRGLIYRAGTSKQFGGYSTTNVSATGTEYLDIELFKAVPKPGDDYFVPNSVSDNLYVFADTYGSTLSVANWNEVFASDEYKALSAEDKALLKNGVASGTDKDGPKTSSEIFANFLNTYDAIAKQYGPEYNTDYLNRDVEYNKYNVSINGVTVATDQVAGTSYTLPTKVSDKVAVSYTIDGETYDPGETIKLHENVAATAELITDVATISVSTEANFSYSLDNKGLFSEITKTTLRMYIELDADTYNYYVSQGYDFSIALSNSSSGKTSKIASSQMSVEYDEEKGVYVFNVALNIPSTTQYETSLGISLVATKSGEEDVSTKSVSVSYKAAAQALYASYQAGTVELTDNQVAALKAILGIN